MGFRVGEKGLKNESCALIFSVFLFFPVECQSCLVLTWNQASVMISGAKGYACSYTVKYLEGRLLGEQQGY